MKIPAAPLLALATLLGSTAFAPDAEAGRPLRTEDAGVLGRGECEVEGVAQRLTVDEVGHANAGSLQFGCGIGWRTQVAMNASRVDDSEDSGNGLAVVGKANLWKSSGGGDDAAGLTLAWNALWTRASGESLRFGASELTMVYSRPLPADLTLHANLGHVREKVGGGDRRSTSWALALEHDGVGPIAPMGEVFGNDRDSDPWWSLALRWTVVPEKFFVDGSYGRQFGGSRAELVTIGFKLAF